jgi:hypothetical protein
MLGFKKFRRTKVTIAGIQPLHRIHKKPVHSWRVSTTRQERTGNLERGTHRIIAMD